LRENRRASTDVISGFLTDVILVLSIECFITWFKKNFLNSVRVFVSSVFTVCLCPCLPCNACVSHALNERQLTVLKSGKVTDSGIMWQLFD